MNMVLTAVLALQMLAALGMIGLILVQHGKGADMGAAFGSGSSGSLFGASGSANFLSRTTGVLAVVFFVCTLALAYFGGGARMVAPSGSVLDRPALHVPPAAGSVAPAAPAAAESVNQIPAGTAARTPAGGGTSSDEIPAPSPLAPGPGQIPTR